MLLMQAQPSVKMTALIVPGQGCPVEEEAHCRDQEDGQSRSPSRSQSAAAAVSTEQS